MFGQKFFYFFLNEVFFVKLNFLNFTYYNNKNVQKKLSTTTITTTTSTKTTPSIK